ncbi:hypothetical protein [Aliamphritea spongicola]|nr:hypothetical protein [Aliamphritea spongicola]
MLTGHLESAISRGRQGRQTFASLSIFDSDNTLKLYIENSTDPFATIQPEQIRIATEMADQKLRKNGNTQPPIMASQLSGKAPPLMPKPC